MNKSLNPSIKNQYVFDIALFSITFIFTLFLISSHSYGRLYPFLGRYSSLVNHALCIGWVLVAGWKLFKKYLEPVPYRLFFLLLLIFFSLISFALGLLKGDLKLSVYESFGNVLEFLLLPVIIAYISEMKITNAIKHIVYIGNFVFSLILISLNYSSIRHYHETKWSTQIESVTLGFHNPNQTGIYLFLCILVLTSALWFYKNIFIKAALILDIAFLFYLTIETDCRSAIIIIGFFFIAALIFNNIHLPKISIGIAMLTPVIYFLLAQYFFQNLSNISFLGENLFTGRESAYSRYLDSIDFSAFLFGNFGEYTFGNLHNGYMAIFATAGIFVFVFFLLFLFQNLKKSFSLCEFKTSQYVAFIGLLCVIIYSSTEAGLFVSNIVHSVLVGTLFILSSPSEKSENPENSQPN